MTQILFAHKIGMGEAYLGDVRRAVTQVQLYPMTVAQVKSADKDGYSALKVAFGKPNKHTNQSAAGQLKGAKTTAKYLREIEFADNLPVGTTLAPTDLISVGTVCVISGTTKGKGRAGVVKKWGFAGGPRTHGQSDRLRRAGSIGQGTTPGRVYKGKHMAGRMGSATVTVKNAQIVSFDPTTNLAWITGPVPGNRGSLLELTVAGHADLTAPVYITGGLIQGAKS